MTAETQEISIYSTLLHPSGQTVNEDLSVKLHKMGLRWPFRSKGARRMETDISLVTQLCPKTKDSDKKRCGATQGTRNLCSSGFMSSQTTILTLTLLLGFPLPQSCSFTTRYQAQPLPTLGSTDCFLADTWSTRGSVTKPTALLHIIHTRISPLTTVGGAPRTRSTGS